MWSSTKYRCTTRNKVRLRKRATKRKRGNGWIHWNADYTKLAKWLMAIHWPHMTDFLRCRCCCCCYCCSKTTINRYIILCVGWVSRIQWKYPWIKLQIRYVWLPLHLIGLNYMEILFWYLFGSTCVEYKHFILVTLNWTLYFHCEISNMFNTMLSFRSLWPETANARTHSHKPING